MTDKAHYQQAASEFEAGQIDQALWIKVEVEHPEATKTMQRAIYIKLRAEELATERLRQLPAKALRSEGIRRLIPRRPWHWLIYAVLVFLLANILGEAAGANAAGSVFTGVMALGIAAGIVIARVNPSDQPRIEWSGWLLWLAEVVLLALLWMAFSEPPTSNVPFWLGAMLVRLGIVCVPGIVVAFGTHFRKPMLAMGITLGWAFVAFVVMAVGQSAATRQLH